MSAFSYIVITLIVLGKIKAEDRTGQDCVIDDFQGQCRLPQDCPSFKIESWQDLQKYTRSMCGFADDLSTVIICCQKASIKTDCTLSSNSWGSKKFCNNLGTRSRRPTCFFDDKDNEGLAELGEFPQLAVLAYSSMKEENEFEFLCAGVLISEKFVLTAAHCLMKRNPVKFVRLGTNELNNLRWATDVFAKVSE